RAHETNPYSAGASIERTHGPPAARESIIRSSALQIGAMPQEDIRRPCANRICRRKWLEIFVLDAFQLSLAVQTASCQRRTVSSKSCRQRCPSEVQIRRRSKMG